MEKQQQQQARVTTTRLIPNQQSNQHSSSSSSSNMMRKVQSFDCAQLGIKSEWSFGPSTKNKNKLLSLQDRKARASRFSQSAQSSHFGTHRPSSKQNLKLPMTPEETTSATLNTSIHKSSFANLLETANHTAEAFSRSTSTSSLPTIDSAVTASGTTQSPATHQNQNGAYSTIPIASLVNMTVLLLLLFGTITDVAVRTMNARITMEDTTTATRSDYVFYQDVFSTELLHPHEVENEEEPKKIVSGGAGVKKHKDGNTDNRLGSAMIGSVTEMLSPILPFAGGVDLRRDGNWKSWRSWLSLFTHDDQDLTSKQTTSTKSSGKNSFSSVPRGGGQRSNNNNGHSKRGPSVFALSTEEPFIPTQDIADMTLQEVTFAFQYAIESGRENFNVKQFLSKGFENGKEAPKNMKDAMKAIDAATTKSRGNGVLPAFTRENKNKGKALSDVGYGDVDALQFCAAMRLFAEWRVLRQVPPGYKGYAVGMSLGHKDVVQNVAKIESAAHDWMDYHSEASTEETLRSPTLRQLLIQEIELDVHPNSKLPQLKEKSAAMGLLWVRRQLQYQTSIFDNILSVPKLFPTMNSAVAGAYTSVYGDLHGWAVQKIFNYSFQSAPEAEEIFRHMNPSELSRVTATASTELQSIEDDDDENTVPDKDIREKEVMETVIAEETVGTSDPFLGARESHSPINDIENVSTIAHNTSNAKEKKNSNPFIEIRDHITSEVDKFGKNFEKEVDKFGKNFEKEADKLGNHISNEWDKLMCGVGNIFRQDDEDCDGNKGNQNRKPNTGMRGGGQKQIVVKAEVLQQYINQKMTMNARKHIISYLKVAKPLLDDLAGLFDEMNMDDPTKV